MSTVSAFALASLTLFLLAFVAFARQVLAQISRLDTTLSHLHQQTNLQIEALSDELATIPRAPAPHSPVLNKIKKQMSKL